MKIGYAHVSNTDQHLDRQIEKLRSEGCEKKFSRINSPVQTENVRR